MKIVCEICRQAIGQFKAEAIERPIRPGMFASIDEAHGLPAPFGDAAALEAIGGTGLEAWQLMRCPICRSFPFLSTDGGGLKHPDWIMIGDGKYWDIPITEADIEEESGDDTEERKMWVCEPCQYRTYKKPLWYQHLRTRKHKELCG